MKLQDINLLDRDTFARGVPHEWFSYLRRNRPLYRHPEPMGPGFWVVSKYADVRAVSRESRHLLVQPNLSARGARTSGPPATPAPRY